MGFRVFGEFWPFPSGIPAGGRLSPPSCTELAPFAVRGLVSQSFGTFLLFHSPCNVVDLSCVLVTFIWFQMKIPSLFIPPSLKAPHPLIFFFFWSLRVFLWRTVSWRFSGALGG